MLKSPISWFGGKFYMLPELLPMIPPHICYGELFGGGGHLLISKPRSEVEIYNDIDSILIQFFTIIQEKDLNHERYERFMHFINWMPYSREKYFECCDWRNESDPEYKIAKWWFSIRMAWGGIPGGTWSSSTQRSSTMKTKSAISRFSTIAERLRDVQLENRDWQVVYERVNKPECFLYLDPPYIQSKRISGEYAYEFSESDHKILIDKLKSTKAKVLLSGYSSELYDDILCSQFHWNRKEVEIVMRFPNARKRIDVLWYNYELPQQELTLF